MTFSFEGNWATPAGRGATVYAGCTADVFPGDVHMWSLGHRILINVTNGSPSASLREAISRVCEAVPGAKGAFRKRKVLCPVSSPCATPLVTLHPAGPPFTAWLLALLNTRTWGPLPCPWVSLADPSQHPSCTLWA